MASARITGATIRNINPWASARRVSLEGRPGALEVQGEIEGSAEGVRQFGSPHEDVKV